MNTIAKAVEMPAPSGYGAAELKKFINKFTVRGFLVTVGLLLIILLLYYLIGVVASSASSAPKLAPIVKLRIEDIPPPQQTEDVPPPPPTQQIINTGPASRAGVPIPVPEALIKEELKDFAKMEELGRASAEGGEGLDLGGFASNIDFDKDLKVQHKEVEPEPDEFIPVEKEPSMDYDRLQKLVNYPDIAKRAGVEGKVIVRALIGKDGKLRKTIIEYSDSELLNDAAMKAVKEYGTFVPAIQNGQPITCWVNIPIIFRLR
jgi:protein TonB